MQEKARPRRDQCMECSLAPVIEVLWAEGMGHAWFCNKHYKEWGKEHPGEVDYEKEIEHGIARSDFHDRKSPISLELRETREKTTPTVSDVHRPASMGEQRGERSGGGRMPYKPDGSDVPDYVPESKREQFARVWNDVYERTKDEQKAYAAARAAIKKSLEGELSQFDKAGRRHSKMDMAMFDEVMGAMSKVMSMMRDLRGGEDGESEDEHEDEQMKGDREQAREAQRRRAAKYGITPGGNVTKPGEWASVPDSDWGDPVRYAYPMPDDAHEMAAMKYFNHSDQQSGGNYNDREWAIIGRRIAQHLGEGYAYRDGKIMNMSEKGERITFTVPIMKADEEKQLCYGVVLKPVPFVDTQSDILKKKEIEQAAHGYIENYRLYDVQHEEDIDVRKAIPVESYIAPQDLELEVGDVKKPIAKGSWVLVTHVKDPEIWKDIKAGKINAYSIVGTGYRREIEGELKDE